LSPVESRRVVGAIVVLANLRFVAERLDEMQQFADATRRRNGLLKACFPPLC
jgi:hypothetical protein